MPRRPFAVPPPPLPLLMPCMGHPGVPRHRTSRSSTIAPVPSTCVNQPPATDPDNAPLPELVAPGGGTSRAGVGAIPAARFVTGPTGTSCIVVAAVTAPFRMASAQTALIDG